MKYSILALSVAVAVVAGSVNAAFFNPTLPFQHEAPAKSPAAAAFLTIPRGGSDFDAGLDNADIAADGNITPSRKCGFCMG